MTATFENERIPSRLFFSCQKSRFLIGDKDHFSDIVRGTMEPWLSLEVGINNIFETPPLRIIGQNGAVVAVKTADATIRLDLESESARKILPDGAESIYRGGLEDANAGLGWMAVR